MPRRSIGGRNGSLGGLSSYWVYQHLGNLQPCGARRKRALPSACSAGRRRVRRASAVRKATTKQRHDGVRWSYVRSLGGTRLIVVDDRTGPRPGGRTSGPDNGPRRTWNWLVQQAANAVRSPRHRGVSDPAFMTPALELSRETGARQCATAPGEHPMAKVGEKLRRGVDFDHWAGVPPGPSTALGRLLRRGVGSREDANRPRSRWCPETCTTPISRRSGFRAGRR